MNRNIIIAARLLSAIFRPQYYSVVAFIVLFMCTWLSLFPLPFKIFVLVIITLGTVALPRMFTRLWRQANGWHLYQLREREKRFAPYLFNIICYGLTLYLLDRLHLPQYMRGVLVGALGIQIACAFINQWWKISTHCAGTGGAIGALVAYSIVFGFNPTGWLCLLILISGLVGSSRMLLRQHTLMQVVAGTIVGCICGFLGIILK